MSGYITIKLRRGTAAQWTSSNPILSDGEVGLETDTRKFKVGNGSGQWTSLQYWGGAGGGASAFVDLTDVPASYSGQGGKLVRVKADASGLEFYTLTIAAGDLPTGIDATKIADGTVSNAEFQRLNGVTSDIQTQLNGKATEGTNVAFTSVNINGTGGNGHVHYKHQSADASATGSSTVVWAANDGELYVKNDGNTKTKLLTAAQIGTDVQAYSSVLANTTASFLTADETKLDGIETGADVTDAGNVGSSIHGATGKTTPVDADTMPLIDSAASNVLKKVTWANLKATLKTYFDTLYQAAGTYLTSANITQVITNGVTDKAPSEDAVFDALAGKQNTLTLTTTGTSGAATLVGATLNIPQYSGGGGSTAWGGITGTLSSQTDLQTALDGKVDENAAITGATKTKVTYDAKGLVTAGADATTADIADSTNKRYVTDAQATVIGNTSGTNTGDNAVNSLYSGLAASKQDTLVSGTNIKTVNSTSLVGSGDVAVQATLVSGTNIKTINGSSILGSGDLVVSGGTNLATVGSNFIYETDFYAQTIPDGLTSYISGAGSGFSYSNTMVEGRPGFAYPSPGTSSGAFSGRAHICPTVDVGPTTGWTVDAGELDMTFIIQTASITQSGTEDYFDIFGLSNSFFNPNPDNSVAITRQQGVNSGNWIFRYRTTSNQVTINGSSGSATSTWFVLRFKVSASTHACEFWINGVSQGTGTPSTKITATNHAALYLGVAKVASAGAEPRPRWDYFRVQQNLNRNT